MPVTRIRVLLAGSELAGGEFVRAMFADADFDVVGEALNPLDLLLAVKATAAHVVVFESQDQEQAALASHLFGEYPHLVVLAVSANRAQIKQLCLREHQLTDCNPDRILSVLRRAVLHPCED